MIENARVRTHSKSPVVRMLYFVYSAAVFNARVMANAMMRIMTGITTEDPLITRQCLKDVIKRGISDYRMLPQPLHRCLPELVLKTESSQLGKTC